MGILEGLNEPQRAAVQTVDTPLLVIAGAGSGKTRVIAHKIAYLVQRVGLAPEQIVAVTFTNKAAREMRERASALLTRTDRRRLTVLTFHALGLRIIRDDAAAFGLRPGFTLMDPQDALAAVKDICRERLGRDACADTVAQRIRAWKDACVSPEQALSEAAPEASVYADYQERLKAYNAIDLDDLIALPANLLARDARARARWRECWRYLLIDEYQDTNDAQYRLAGALAGPAFTAVGDDDQSIYSWRGARPENLRRLTEDHPNLKVIPLEQNYRSTGRILKAANAVIGHNPHLFPKRLWSALGFGEPLRILVARDEAHEAARVVAQLLHDKFVRQGRYDDYAILYRGNHQARPFEQVLREHRIPYALSGTTSFFDRAEIRDLIAYLRLLHNPADDAAFLRICNVPRRDIGPATVARLRAYAERRNQPLLICCQELALAQHVPGPQAAALRRLAVLLETLRDRAAHGPAGAVARALLADIGYEDFVRAEADDAAQARRRLDALGDFLAWVDRLGAEDERAFGDVVAHIVLSGMGDPGREPDGECVRLMTLHAAKGLEFPHVFLVGAEEGLLPHQASQDGPALEEERRLAYVGMTRARQTLTISYAGKRRRHGESVETEPSRFLQEIPSEDILWDGRADKPREERLAHGATHLEGLRALLNR